MKRLKKRVECVFTREGAPMFFKLSTRSPKDAWQQIDPSIGVDEDDDDDTRRRKLELQTRLLCVNDFKDIMNLVRCSERLTDDLQQYIEHSTVDQTMCIVLQEWRPSYGEEYRCFVKHGKLIACCRYHAKNSEEAKENPVVPFDHSIPTEHIRSFVAILMSKLSGGYNECVADVFVKDDRVFLIELNPFDEDTDPIKFTWAYLNSCLEQESGVGGPGDATQDPMHINILTPL